MIVQDNLLNDFYTLISNYDMNSVFTMPNVHNHELLKRHFYVIYRLVMFQSHFQFLIHLI